MDSQLIAAIVGGLIGVFGSVATLIASQYIKQSGKITVNLTRSNIMLSKPDEAGGQVATSNLDESDTLNISLGIDIYNSSEVPRSLRELGIEVIPRKGKGFSIPPSVLKERSNIPTFIPYRKLEIINLPPKELTHLDLQTWEKLDHSYHELKGSLTFSFVARYPNGKKFKVRLITVDLEKPALQTE